MEHTNWSWSKPISRIRNRGQISSCPPPNVNMACKPSSGAIPKKRSTQKQLHKAVDQEQADTGSETRVAVAEYFSISSLGTTKGERTEKIEKNYQSLGSECPPQSLPPPEENAIKDVAKGNMEKDSGTDVSKEFNRLLSNVKSRKSNSCPKGPHSPEEVSSKQNSSPFVTGLSCRPWVKHYMTVVHGGLGESGCPTENNEGLDKEGTQELVRKLSQMYIEKEMECKRLGELTFSDEQVASFLEEMGAYLEGRLAQLDAARPQMDYLTRWDNMVVMAVQFIRQSANADTMIGNQPNSETPSSTTDP